MEDLLQDHKTAFCNYAGTLEQTALVQHDIFAVSHRPVKQAPRWRPIHGQHVAQEAVGNMIRKGSYRKVPFHRRSDCLGVGK